MGNERNFRLWNSKPRVINNCKIDSQTYSGLAFGLGVERIAMLKYGVNDIREFLQV